MTDTEHARIELRADTAANWTAANPVLAAGEPAWETDAKKLKIGDGVTTWNALAYYSTPTDPEVVRDTIVAALVAGPNVTVVGDDPADTITISATGGSGSVQRVKLDDQTLGAAAASITFASIPSTYDDLEIVLEGKNTAGTTSINLVVNGDTTAANYKREILFGSVGSAAAGSAASNAAAAIAATDSQSILTLKGYKGTTRKKIVSVRSDLPEDFGLYFYCMTWLNTAAINSFALVSPSGNFAAGTRARLYGLKD